MRIPAPLRLAVAGSLALAIGSAVPAHGIIDGRRVAETPYPWFVDFKGCGATLIAPDRVLTAAHCVADKVPADLGRVVVAGAPDQPVTVTGIASHPGFSPVKLSTLARGWPDYDVAVLRLAAPVRGVELIAPARPRSGRPMEVIGRGVTGSGAVPRRNPLRSATLTTLTDAACLARWRRLDAEDAKLMKGRIMVCGADPRRRARPQRGVCSGDSGGPALQRQGGRTVQLGVSSWIGDQCGTGPSVYTELAAVRAFIDRRDQPWAPIPAGRPVLEGAGEVGSTLRCTPPAWTVPPATTTVAFTTVRFPRGVVDLQSGAASEYVVRAEDRNRAISCSVRAATAGGRLETIATREVQVR